VHNAVVGWRGVWSALRCVLRALKERESAGGLAGRAAGATPGPVLSLLLPSSAVGVSATVYMLRWHGPGTPNTSQECSAVRPTTQWNIKDHQDP
jgi:hypothetical protein